MRTVRNNIIPFGRFKAINLFGVVFYKGCYPRKRTINHEAIHTQQIKECLYVFYYPLYILFWMLGGFKYENNRFEKEAIDNDGDFNYTKTRKKFSWLR